MKHALVVALLVAISAVPASAQEWVSFGFGIGVSNKSPTQLSLGGVLKADVRTPIEIVGARAEGVVQMNGGTGELVLLSLTVSPTTEPVRPYLIVSPGWALADGPEFAFGFGMGAEVQEGAVPLFFEFRGFMEPGVRDFGLAVVGLRF